MFKGAIFFLILLFSWPSNAQRLTNIGGSNSSTAACANFTYYVDSVNGSDSNNGTSVTTPYQNITALPANPPSGTKIALMANSYWRQFLNFGSANNVANIQVIGCGPGTQPVLDASDIISSSVWSAVGGLTATYQTSALTGPGAGSTEIGVFEDGIFAAYKSSQALVAACTGLCFTVDSETSPTVHITVRASNGSNPATNGNVYEYTARPAGMFLESTGGAYVSNINFKRAGNSSGALEIIGDGSNPLIDTITCTQGGRHCVQMPTGTIQNSTFNDVYEPIVNGVAGFIVFFENTGSGKPSYSINNTFNFGATNTAATIAAGSTGQAVTWHTGSESLGDISFINNNATVSNGYLFNGYGGANSASWSVIGGVLNEITLAVSSQAGQTVTVNGLQQKTISASEAVFASLSGATTLNIVNTSLCLANIRQGMIRKTDSAVAAINISGGNFYARPVQNSSVSLIADFGANLTWRVNGAMIDTTQNANSWAWNGSGTGEQYSGNNNHFPGVAKWTKNGVTSASLAAWKLAVSPQDANSDAIGSGVAACN